MTRLFRTILLLGIALGLAAAGWADEDTGEEPVFEVEVVGEAGPGAGVERRRA